MFNEYDDMVTIEELCYSVGETKATTANAGVIRITGRGITAELPQDISPKLLTALLKGLSSC